MLTHTHTHEEGHEEDALMGQKLTRSHLKWNVFIQRPGQTTYNVYFQQIILRQSDNKAPLVKPEWPVWL